MELGTYRLAEINKGGGLRQKAVGLATQYLNGVGDWVAMPTAMTPTAHNHSIPDLHCGVSNIVAGRILISGSGETSNPTWLAAGTNGQILGWTSDAPAWVDAPSGGTGRVRNFLTLSEGALLTPDVGTDLLVFFERQEATTQTLNFLTPNMASRAGDIIRVVLCGNCKLTFSTGSENHKIKPAYYGATANDNLTTQSTTGDWTFICDGTNWRAHMLPQLFE